MHGSVASEGVYRHLGGRLNAYILATAAVVAVAFVVAPIAGAGSAAAAPTATVTAQRPTATAKRPTPPCPNSNLQPTPADIPAVAAATTCLIDSLRVAHRLPPLRANRSLQAVAGGQSREMVLGDYFGDNSRSGQTPLRRIVAAHYLGHSRGASMGQNIGWGTGPDATPAGIVQAWMRSPPHRQIMLTGEFRDIGVGVAPAAPAALAEGQVGATYTVDFAVRKR